MAKNLRWDLDEIYKGVDDRELKSDFNRVKDIAKKIESLNNTGDINYVKRVLSLYEEQITLLNTIGSYAYALLSVETNNEDYSKLVNKFNDMTVFASKTNVLISNEFSLLEDIILPHLDSDLKEYHFVIREIIENKKHQMNPELEELSDELSNNGVEALSRLQEAISSSASKTIDGEILTVTQLRALATDKDRNKRKAAYEAELEVWKENELAIATCLNSIKGTKIVLDRKRNYESPLACSLRQSRISQKVLDALIGSVEDYLVDFRRYFKLKAKMLGVDKLAFFDIFAPSSESDRTYTYEEAQDFILKQFESFHPNLSSFAKNCFEKRYLDVESRKGKVGGAYCTSFPKIKQIRIMSNFDGSYQALSTVAHELGHGYHDFVCKDNPMLLKEYPMTIAETASIFCEYLAFTGALNQAKEKEERISLIESFLSECSQSCVDVLGRFYFESAVYEERKSGELSPSRFSELMLEAQDRTYGDGLDSKYRHQYMWAVKGHYYMPSLSFYNFPYIFGQLFSLGLARVYEKEGKSFTSTYDALLKSSASDTIENIALSVNLDITSKKFWKGSLEIIKKYVDELEELLK